MSELLSFSAVPNAEPQLDWFWTFFHFFFEFLTRHIKKRKATCTIILTPTTKEPKKFHAIHFVYSYPNLLTLYVQYTKNLAVKKCLPFDPICEVYLEYIVIIHFVFPNPNLLTFYVQYTKTLAVKKWLPFELIWGLASICINLSLTAHRKLFCSMVWRLIWINFGTQS